MRSLVCFSRLTISIARLTKEEKVRLLVNAKAENGEDAQSIEKLEEEIHDLSLYVESNSIFAYIPVWRRERERKRLLRIEKVNANNLLAQQRQVDKATSPTSVQNDLE
jgi:uncharacterized protein YjcR